MGSGTPAKRPSGRDRFGEPRDAIVPPKRRAITGWCLDLMVARPRASKDLRDPGATLNDLRQAVTTLEDTERTARRVLGGAHPLTSVIEENLRKSRAALRARETPSARTA